MNTLSDNQLLLYRKLGKKRAFVYEIKDKLYAVSGNKIIEIQGGYNKCHYDVYKRLLVFQHQKERICNSMGKLAVVARAECAFESMKLSSFIQGSDIHSMEQLEEGMDNYDINYKKYCCPAWAQSNG